MNERMTWRLRDGLHWCDCGGLALFLDIPADLYFCLPRDANAAFLRAAANEADRRDCERLAPLVRRGLLVEDDSGQAIRRPPRVDLPEGNYPAGARTRVGLFRILRMISAELRTGRQLKRKPLLEVIESVERVRPARRPCGRDEQRLAESLAAASAVTAFLLRSHDRCLVRGLAFHRSCRKHGLGTKLVLGVTGHPFTAHCWVQLGKLVLVGGYEQARLHTPVFVLE